MQATLTGYATPSAAVHAEESTKTPQEQAQCAWVLVASKDDWERWQGLGSYGSSSVCRRFEDARPGEPVAVYLRDEASFAGIGVVNRRYCYYDTAIWKDEAHPHRIGVELDLDYNNLVDVRTVVGSLEFVASKADWMAFFETEAVCISISDYEVIAGAIDRKRKGLEVGLGATACSATNNLAQTIMDRQDLRATTLKDRLAEMIRAVGTKVGYDARERYKPNANSPFPIDVAWLREGILEIAVAVHDVGSIEEALARLRHASGFNFRKAVLVVVNPQDAKGISDMIASDEQLGDRVDLWSAESVNRMYSDCISFFGMCARFERFGQMAALGSL